MTIPAISYQVTCPCGQVLSGPRQTSFQVVRCPSCSSDRFILPRSPFSPDNGQAKSAQAATRPFPLKLWLLPGLATAISLVGLLAIYLIFFNKPENPLNGGNGKETRSDQERLVLAEKYLGEGSFRLAANELAAQPAEPLSTLQKRRWQQLNREASILADLSVEPIEDILRHAAGVSDQEWQAEFPVRYQGKALLFDVHLQRLALGKVQADYVLPGRDPVRLEWGELDVLGTMDLSESRRVILGVRLGRITLEPPGPAWVVHFQPKSGVLLTDARAASLCCPPLGEPDVLGVLKRQAKMAGK